MTTDIGELRARLTMEAQNFRQGMQQTRSALLNTTNSTRATNSAMRGLQTTTARMRQAAEEGIVPTSRLAQNLETQMGGVRDVSSETVQAVSELGGAVSDLGPAAEAGVGNATTSIEEMLQTIQTVSATIAGAIVAGVGVSVKTAADFEAQMSRVKAISGATDGEFQNLKESALELGASTSKSASEVAIAFEDMAAKGFNATQIMEAMPGVIAAAEASGSDLALTAEVVASALNGFQMEAAEASRVADILAKTANISAASMDDMAYAFKYVAPVANTLGMSIEEVSAAIGIMTNSGLDGSSAGTALRAALLALNNPAKEQEKLMKELGFSLKDSTGNAKSLSQMFGDLTDATKNMTQAEKVATIAKLVGTEASSGMLSVMEGGVDQLNEFTASLKNSSGASKDAANTMKNNLKGAFDELSGALETVGIKVGDEFIPLLTDVTKKGAEVVGAISEMDMSAVKSGVAFAGTAAGIALVISTVGRLAVAVKTLMVSMGPAGWLITGISVLGGVIASSVVHQKEMSKVTLENAEAMIDSQQALEGNIAQYDSLKLKSKLTTDELARFVDINSEISKTADPNIIAALKDEQAKLQEKSGLTNEELNRMVELNGKIIEVVPESSTKLTEQGNVLLENTDAAKKYNAEQVEMIRLELEKQKAKAEASMEKNLIKEKTLLEEMKILKQDMNTLNEAEIDQRNIVSGLERELASAKANNDEDEVNRLNFLIATEKQKHQIAKDQVATQADLILTKAEEIDKIQAQIGKLDEVNRKMIDLEMKQAGINAKRGEEVSTIESALAGLEAQKRRLEETTPVVQRNSGEYRDAVTHIENQIIELNKVKDRIYEITGAAGVMNTELGKQIRKDVIIRQVAGQSLKRMPELDYHTGGLIGRGQMPTLHTGGLAAQYANLPSHNEIDVRLLRNEMVLTEAQQANLMRMIDEGLVGRKTEPASHPENAREPNLFIEVPVILEGREVARGTYKYTTEFQEFEKDRSKSF
jgi:TP901 family phage tail tape measure protein